MPGTMNRKNRWLIPFGIALGGLLVYATMIEPRWLQLRKSRVNARRLPHAFNGLRIALLTDLHVGGGTSVGLIRRAAALPSASGQTSSRSPVISQPIPPKTSTMCSTRCQS